MMKDKIFTISTVGLVIGPTISIVAHAEIFMSPEKAVTTIFPSGTFEKIEIDLSESEVKEIEEKSGETVKSKTLSVWKDKNKNTVFLDQVLGKHEFITYVVGISGGSIKGIEILEYRESYGGQIRKEEWRKQFLGKTKLSPLKLDEDIKNISGATLSSAHVTSGARRILFTYETIRNRI